MKIALCTTTINVPHVLKLHRAYDPDVKIFVAIDQKTPAESCELIREIGGEISSGSEYKCSALIGFNSIQRRNVAFLDALSWGADIIVSIDDDNIPLTEPYCLRHATNLINAHNGLMVRNTNEKHNWFDAGTLLQPPAKHRGFPYHVERRNVFTHAVGAKVGVSAGICLGDPDIDAATRIAAGPEVHQVSQVLEAGMVAHPHTWTVFNSQNTAVLREFIPAWGMIPFVGRMDDIYASLIAQRVMREREYHVRFGKPFAFQQRNDHNLVTDLRGELDGYENTARLADALDQIILKGKSVIDDCRTTWDALSRLDYIPDRSVSAMMSYIDDCETAL